jgi:hypothetical protein
MSANRRNTLKGVQVSSGYRRMAGMYQGTSLRLRSEQAFTCRPFL